MSPKTVLLWLAAQLLSVHVRAPGELDETRKPSIQCLQESAVRFYPCYTDSANEKSEHYHLQFRRQAFVGREERRSVLVLKTLRELFVINLHLCGTTHNTSASMDLNVETKNNTDCWQGTVNNAKDSNAVVIKNNGNLLEASIRYRHHKYIIESRSHPGTENCMYIVYMEPDLIQQSPSNVSSPCNVRNRNRRQIYDGILDYPKEYSDEAALEGLDKDHVGADSVSDEDIPKQRCVVKLVADHTYFRKIGSSDAQKTRASMIHQILRVNGILKLPFDITPGLVRIFENTTEVPPGGVHFNMPEGTNVTTSELLNSFSSVDRVRNHDNSGFCLAFLFTARILDGGLVRGLANIGHPTQDVGVCSSVVRDAGTGAEHVSNGGLATSMPQGQRMLTRDSDLLVAHEVAHILGAEHDPDSGECSPPDEKGGPYLMSARPVSRYSKNHDRLSACSIRQITTAVKFKSHCFREASSCGNVKVDEDEQCDVGMVEDDLCCNTQCRLHPNASCSDMNDRCCENCQLMREGTLCKVEFPNECLRSSTCSGESGRCPVQKAMPDNSSCVDRGQCLDGRCISYCEVLGMLPCLCKDGYACTRCCKRTVEDNCRPIFPLDYLVDGTVCFNGFCQDRKCRKQVQDFIERIVNIVSKLSPSYVKQQLQKYGTTFLIIILCSLWIPFAIWLHCHDKRYYNVSGTPRADIASPVDRATDIVPLSFSRESIEFIDEEPCSQPSSGALCEPNGNCHIVRETAV